jgi:4-aminobutyrate aminotransferase-like enzyme
VWDPRRKQYLDLTAAFGVAAAGHAHPRIVRAGQRQMARLLHAMGDFHPHPLKARLARELSRVTYERWSRRAPAAGDRLRRPLRGKTIFCNSGFESVEAALKTALLHTGRPGVIAFHGAYHGLGYGALNATARVEFRKPFLSQLGQFGVFAPFPVAAGQLPSLQETIERLFREQSIGAILVEPVQGRGGINVPPGGLLPLLRTLATKHDALLIADEVFTGFGRTGKWFACEHSSIVPDIICLGKALTGGFPLSACVGEATLMDRAWPPSQGEAIHTSTFLGHPVGCAMALASIETIRRLSLVRRSARMGAYLLRELRSIHAPHGLVVSARGLGLMAGLEIRTDQDQPATPTTLHIIEELLHQGFILLPEGESGNVIGFTPPLTISEKELDRALSALKKRLQTLRNNSGLVLQ